MYSTLKETLFSLTDDSGLAGLGKFLGPIVGNPQNHFGSERLFETIQALDPTVRRPDSRVTFDAFIEGLNRRQAQDIELDCEDCPSNAHLQVKCENCGKIGPACLRHSAES
jgi:hypothetical protein